MIQTVSILQILDQLLLIVVPAVGLFKLLMNEVFGLGQILQSTFECQDLVILDGALLHKTIGDWVFHWWLVILHSSCIASVLFEIDFFHFNCFICLLVFHFIF